MVEGAFKGIVEQATFDRAQRVIRQRLNYKSDETVLRELKVLCRRHGTLSEAMIDPAPGVPAVSGLRHRVGSMVKVYGLLGFKPAPIDAMSTSKAKMMSRLRGQLLASIRESFPYDVTFTRLSSRHLYCFAFQPSGMSLWFCAVQLTDQQGCGVGSCPRDLSFAMCQHWCACCHAITNRSRSITSFKGMRRVLHVG